MVELREIDRDNFGDVLDLSVSDEQKHFVASNAYSLAQAKAQPECVPLAIYSGEEPVGFLMYCMDLDDGEYWIYRLMIDQKHQNRGYGRAAMRSVLETMARDAERNMVYISFEPNNVAAKRLYESFGFIPDGRVMGGEVVYCLRWA